ncbi:MAG TPA: hypothetical protein VK821_16680 [Dehalococcoidia bacterium]|nr:hypothetical protein [Dehalococcoidia bacterium]
MILFFDRNAGTTVPKALQALKPPVGITYHQEHFPMNSPDDVWLPQVGAWDWIVLTQDHKFHLLPNELRALKDYNIGCFYLWGAKATKWELMRSFARCYDRLLDRAMNTPRPFIYKVSKDGRLIAVRIP